MIYTYCLRTDKILGEDGILHIVYGIEAVNEEEVVLASFPDIFIDRIKALLLIELCNGLELSLIHLTEVIEDILE